MRTYSYPRGGPPVVREDGVIVKPAPIVARDWIVIQGSAVSLVNSTDGRGGFEFFGPFTEQEANFVAFNLGENTHCLQLVKLPRLVEAHRQGEPA